MTDLTDHDLDVAAKAALVTALVTKESPDEIPWEVCEQLANLGLVKVLHAHMRVDESKMWNPEGKLDSGAATCWGTIELMPVGRIVARLLKDQMNDRALYAELRAFARKNMAIGMLERFPVSLDDETEHE